jgi:Tfp pilus assembly protein PilW
MPAMMMQRRGSRGFSLVECVVAVAVGMSILGAVYMSVWTGQRSATGIDRKVTTGQDARAALEVMAMEMRMASYNPFYAANPWTDITSCNAGDSARRGIQNATANTIQIQMDLSGNGACGDAANEIIVYALDAVNQRITREPWTCSGSPISAGVQSFLGAAAGETKTARVVNADAGVAIPLFRYFNSTGTDITGSLPGAINQIRRIEITLVVDSENVDPSLAGSQRRRMIYSTSVVPRNHAFLF